MMKILSGIKKNQVLFIHSNDHLGEQTEIWLKALASHKIKRESKKINHSWI